MQKIKVGVIGGAGYTGGELVRLLIHHPYISISFINSRSNAGKPLHHVHFDLIGETTIKFSSEVNERVDVLFLCMGHGESRKFLEQYSVDSNTKIIDLSQDFRLAPTAQFGSRNFVYGLPELNKTVLLSANNVANPGCFATAIQLGLLPLAEHGLLGEIHTTGITGSTGAGQGFSTTSHFSWRANNIQAYKTLTHQHLGEITQSLKQLGTAEPLLNFIPWRGDFTRGIFTSSNIACKEDLNQVVDLYEDYYKDSPFTIVSDQQIHLKQVVNTNKCIIQLEKEGSKLVVHTAIDNLLKGASGQAVQNMNIMFGFEETTGLNLKANAF